HPVDQGHALRVALDVREHGPDPLHAHVEEADRGGGRWAAVRPPRGADDRTAGGGRHRHEVIQVHLFFLSFPPRGCRGASNAPTRSCSRRSPVNARSAPRSPERTTSSGARASAAVRRSVFIARSQPVTSAVSGRSRAMRLTSGRVELFSIRNRTLPLR